MLRTEDAMVRAAKNLALGRFGFPELLPRIEVVQFGVVVGEPCVVANARKPGSFVQTAVLVIEFELC